MHILRMQQEQEQWRVFSGLGSLQQCPEIVHCSHLQKYIQGSAGLLVSSSGLLTTDAFLICYFTGKIRLNVPSLQREQHTKENMKLLQETNKFQMAWEHSKMFTIEEGSV